MKSVVTFGEPATGPVTFGVATVSLAVTVQLKVPPLGMLTVVTACQVIPVTSDMGALPEVVVLKYEADQSTVAEPTPDGSVISAKKVTVQAGNGVAVPPVKVIGLALKALIVGPTMSGVLVGVGVLVTVGGIVGVGGAVGVAVLVAVAVLVLVGSGVKVEVAGGGRVLVGMSVGTLVAVGNGLKVAVGGTGVSVSAGG